MKIKIDFILICRWAVSSTPQLIFYSRRDERPSPPPPPSQLHKKNVYITTNGTGNEGANAPSEPRFVRFPRDPRQEAREKRRMDQLAAMGGTDREICDEKLRRELKEREKRWLKKMDRLDKERIRRCGHYYINYY
jgi:hypothetical protein